MIAAEFVIKIESRFVAVTRWLKSFLSLVSVVSLVLMALMLFSCSEKTTEPTKNLRPSAPSIADGPTLAMIGIAVSYRSLANDADSDSLRLIFHWGDGDSTISQLAPSAAAVDLSHTYDSEGSFRIFVIARDKEGLYSDSSEGLRISVIPPGPLPPTRPEGPDTLFLNQLYQFRSQGITLLGDSLRLVFFWGDGDSTVTNWDSTGAVFSGQHAFYEAGDFFVRAVAVDDQDSVSSLSPGKQVTVVNRAPLEPDPPFGPVVARVAENVTFYSVVTDPEGDHLSVFFHWGDGALAHSPTQESGSIFSATHSYSDTGVFEISVSATDMFGNESDTSLTSAIFINGFPSDTVRFFTSGLDNDLIIIERSWRVVWINNDPTQVSHTVVSDTSGLFSTRFLRFGQSDEVSFDSVGSFTYHCRDHPALNSEKGAIIVNDR